MGMTRILLLTGVAAVSLAGYTGPAQAKALRTHVLNIALPDGQVEQVRYTGDVPPTVIVEPVAAATDVDPASLDRVSPFAMLDQLTEAMDRQAEAVFQAIDAEGASGPMGYAMTPALSGPGVCMHSVQITYAGDGRAPHVVSRTAGDCGSAGVRRAPAALPDTIAPEPAPRLIEAKSGEAKSGEAKSGEAKAERPLQRLVQLASDQR